ncbi:MAG: branched-chain amino acid ABC transporter permease [Actinomycetota bacterium]|nr:branched-chain amino acid ABC transporter permease [Actinomycetota bacterium]
MNGGLLGGSAALTGTAPSGATPEGPGQPARGVPWAKVCTWLAMALVVLAFPVVFPTPAVTSIAFFSVIFMAAATAWNTFSGYSGYISIGHAVFFGSGAYTLALLAVHLNLAGGMGIFWLVPVAGAVAMAIAVPFGLVALRTRRHTFVVMTIAAFFVFQLLAYNLSSFTQGSAGVSLPTPPWTATGFNQRFYYVAVAVLVVALGLSVAVRRSRFGLQLLAIRDDEDRAAGLGVKTTRVKLTAFVLSAFSVGMAGAVWAYFLGEIHPQFAFTALFDLSVAIMCFLGGFGTITGPLLGAALLESLQQYFTIQYSADNLYLIAYGVLFLAVIALLPRGVIPTVSGAYRDWQDRRLQRRVETVARSAGATGPPGVPVLERAASSARAQER